MVTSMLPHPKAPSGGAVVMYGQLAMLVAHHEVVLATFAGGDDAEREVIKNLRESGIDVRFVWRSWPSGFHLWQRRLRDAFCWLQGGRPLRTLQFYEPAMQRLLDQLLAEQKFDLLQVEDNAMANYRYGARMPTVLTEHEVRSAVPAGIRHQTRARWVQRAVGGAEQRRWQDYQRSIWCRFDRIQVFTSRDAEIAGAIAPELVDRLRVNPFGVEIPPAADPGREKPGTIVFVGGFGHPPNIDSALWLGHEIMPRLRRHRPGVQLTIVGSYPPKSVLGLARDDVVVTGHVPAVEPFLEQSAIVVAPIRTGGGMRVKVLQAMAFGKAVVTTRLGAEGLPMAGCQPPVAIAEGAEDFARATAMLLGAEKTRRALGRCARAFVSEHHSWPAYRRRLEALYAELQPG